MGTPVHFRNILDFDQTDCYRSSVSNAIERKFLVLAQDMVDEKNIYDNAIRYSGFRTLSGIRACMTRSGLTILQNIPRWGAILLYATYALASALLCVKFLAPIFMPQIALVYIGSVIIGVGFHMAICRLLIAITNYDNAIRPLFAKRAKIVGDIKKLLREDASIQDETGLPRKFFITLKQCYKYNIPHENSYYDVLKVRDTFLSA